MSCNSIIFPGRRKPGCRITYSIPFHERIMGTAVPKNMYLYMNKYLGTPANFLPFLEATGILRLTKSREVGNSACLPIAAANSP